MKKLIFLLLLVPVMVQGQSRMKKNWTFQDTVTFNKHTVFDRGMAVGKASAFSDAVTFDSITVGDKAVFNDDVTITGDLILGASAQPRAFFSVQDSAREITVSAKNTWYHIKNSWGSLLTISDAYRVSETLDTVFLSDTGWYEGNVSLSLLGDSSHYSVGIAVNGTVDKKMKFFVMPDDTVSVSFPYVIDCTQNADVDTLYLMIKNHTDTDNLTVVDLLWQVKFLHK